MFRHIALLAIRFYQKTVSPFLPSSCRFYPSCSEYSKDAITRHGVARGAWLTLRRLCKCHPFHPGGFDPAP